jgi:hypothetical protein
VLSVEASRSARNGRDWHTLLEFCGLVGTIIVDEAGVYDPALTRIVSGHPNSEIDQLMPSFRLGRAVELRLRTARIFHLKDNWVRFAKIALVS